MTQTKLELKMEQFNYFSGHKYQGINSQELARVQTEHEFKSNQWATYGQWFSKKMQVQKGQHGTSIMIFVPNEDDPKKPKVGYCKVFNLDQVAPVEVEQS